jgi:hypothetical protein
MRDLTDYRADAGLEEDEEVVNDADALVVAGNGLTHSQAELLCDGYVNGLLESADLPSHLIDAFLEDQEAVERLKVPDDMSPADRAVFKRGALGGLRLASMGYWLDVDESAHTIH